MIKYIILFASVIPSAMAQILLKKASSFQIFTMFWFVFMFFSICCYGASFVLYTIAFKYLPVSVANPVMTISVMLIVFLFGVLIGETVTIKQIVGVVLGALSVVLIILR